MGNDDFIQVAQRFGDAFGNASPEVVDPQVEELFGTGNKLVKC